MASQKISQDAPEACARGTTFSGGNWTSTQAKQGRRMRSIPQFHPSQLAWHNRYRLAVDELLEALVNIGIYVLLFGALA
jgi:hypothetical protein